MKTVFSFCCVWAFLLILCTGTVEATSCLSPGFEKSFGDAALVFTGRAIHSEFTSEEMLEAHRLQHDIAPDSRDNLPDAYTDFEIDSQYKGLSRKKVRVFYNTGREQRKKNIPWPVSGPPPPPYSVGTEATLFADYKNGVYTVYRGFCSRNYHGNPKLQEIARRYDALEGAIVQSPANPEAYLEKADAYEGYRDYGNSVAVYERLFNAVKAAQKDDEINVAYGRNLYFSGRYGDAVETLKLLLKHSEAVTYFQLSKLRLNHLDDLAGQALLMAGQEISDLTLEGGDFPHSDFSGAKLSKAKFVNVKMRGSDFSGAEFQGEVLDSDLTETKFDDVRIFATLRNSRFDKASFVNARIKASESSRNSFKGANFLSARLDIMGCTRPSEELEGSDFTKADFGNAMVVGVFKSKLSGANFTGATFEGSCISPNQRIDLSGRHLDNMNFERGDYSGSSFKKASLQSSNFSGANLTDVDFSDADLTAADFTVSSYNGPAKLNGADFTGAKIDKTNWEGAVYDCQTKFPEGFDPVISKLEPADKSCYFPKGAGIVLYSPERFQRGRIKVCNGDFTSGCVYAFLINYLVNGIGDVPRLRHRFFKGLAASLMNAGEYEMARLVLMRYIAELGQARAGLPDGVQELINALHSKIPPDESFIQAVTARGSRTNPMWTRRQLMLEYLSAGDKTKAREMAMDSFAKIHKVAEGIAALNQAEVLLTYADVIARTENDLDLKVVQVLEQHIRSAPGNSKMFPSIDDYVAAGEIILSESR